MERVYRTFCERRGDSKHWEYIRYALFAERSRLLECGEARALRTWLAGLSMVENALGGGRKNLMGFEFGELDVGLAGVVLGFESESDRALSDRWRISGRCVGHVVPRARR
jgi:hypothetical protein